MATLNQMTREDYLRAEGAQMMIRLLCDLWQNDICSFYHKDGEKVSVVKCTPIQMLDAIRRFSAGVMNANAYLKNEAVVYCPVWCEIKGKPIIQRIDIITKNEYDRQQKNALTTSISHTYMSSKSSEDNKRLINN